MKMKHPYIAYFKIYIKSYKTSQYDLLYEKSILYCIVAIQTISYIATQSNIDIHHDKIAHGYRRC